MNSLYLEGFLVHGWDNIGTIVFFVYSLFGLSTLKHVKCYPTMTKILGLGFGVA